METLNKLVVKNLSCSYGEKQVLNNISFSLKDKEVLAVIGSAGIGKSTLAYCLSGIIPNKIKGTVNGEILFHNENILGKKPSELVGKIGFIMQDYDTQIFGLTVEEDIRFGLENLGFDEVEIEKRINWVLKSLGLERYKKTYTSQLSSGLKQKLVIASTVAMNPDVIIMDDPLLNLDWIGIKNLEKIIIDLKKQGTSFIILTKHIEGLHNAIDKVISLDNNTTNIEKVKSWSMSEMSRIRKSEELIKLDKVWFKYSNGDFIIKNLTLSVNKYDIIAIMGPNGSGKTTLIKLMSGLLKPTKGYVTVVGKDTKKYSASKLANHVSIVFQNPEKYITFETVWDEATFGCKNLKLPLIYAENSLKLFNLYERRQDPPYELSMSEKIKLHIVSALALNPDILILDEPVTIHDTNSLMPLKTTIEQLHKQGKAVIIVTHDTDLALHLCNRIIIINNGTIAADNTPDLIFSDDKLIKQIGLKPINTYEIGLTIKDKCSSDLL
ncbi:MAG: ABC transporter ATP-binding protein [Thermoprotei archaeon]